MSGRGQIRRLLVCAGGRMIRKREKEREKIGPRSGHCIYVTKNGGRGPAITVDNLMSAIPFAPRPPRTCSNTAARLYAPFRQPRPGTSHDVGERMLPRHRAAARCVDSGQRSCARGAPPAQAPCSRPTITHHSPRLSPVRCCNNLTALHRIYLLCSPGRPVRTLSVVAKPQRRFMCGERGHQMHRSGWG